MKSGIIFKDVGLKRRTVTMLRADFRRMFTSYFLYIMVGICFVMPILILVMTTMMDGMESVNPTTNEVTIIQGFDNVWQIIGSVSGDGMGAENSGEMGMSLTSMCNINMLYFLISVLVCVFVSDDFRSGFAKNIFTVRVQRTDYVISKTIVTATGSALMVLAFLLGSLIGGAVSGLPFEMVGFGGMELLFSVISKLALVLVFVPIYLVMAVCAKGRAWLSILLSMMVGMFLFMMIPMLTPLDATIIHPILCLGGGILFAIGFGAVSGAVLRRGNIL